MYGFFDTSGTGTDDILKWGFSRYHRKNPSCRFLRWEVSNLIVVVVSSPQNQFSFIDINAL